MAGRQRKLLFSCVLTLCCAFSLAAQARGGGGHSSAPSASAKNAGSTSDWHTHIHPQSPAASAKAGTFKPNKNRVDPYKNYKFR